MLTPALEQLNLFGCRHLSQVSVEALVLTAARLAHCDVNGCNQIRELRLDGAKRCCCCFLRWRRGGWVDVWWEWTPSCLREVASFCLELLLCSVMR